LPTLRQPTTEYNRVGIESNATPPPFQT